jgi:hypothetical protein
MFVSFRFGMAILLVKKGFLEIKQGMGLDLSGGSSSARFKG